MQTARFISVTTDIGVVNAGATTDVDLTSIRTNYGDNLNTLSIVNNDAVEISIYLDGKQVLYVPKSGGAISLDWRDNINYTILRIKNEDGATATTANKIRITVGRTGV